MDQAITPGWATYLRVSDEEKQSPERSFAMQRKDINDFLLEKSDVGFYKEYQDRLSGTTANRDQYQQMLRDAADGKFSHLGLYKADRFGRDTVEGLQTAKKLIELGIKIRVANSPTLRPEEPNGLFFFQMLMGMAQLEVDVMRKRIRDGTEAKMRAGGWPYKAPEGYLNREKQIKSGKYDRWVERDPIYSPGIKKAWDLLLTDRYTIRQICDELAKEGFIRSNGRPWAWDDPKTSNRAFARSSLHKIFYNAFYAGWVISKPYKILYGDIRGDWEPIVSSREFEKGISILKRHYDQKSRPKRQSYLLRNLLWIEAENGKRYKMYGSTPSGRSKSYFYYITHAKPEGKVIRLAGPEIDEQIPRWLNQIGISQDLIPKIKSIYREQINSNSEEKQKNKVEYLKNKIAALNQEEERLGRLYVSGNISEDAYKKLHAEWWEKIQNAKITLEKYTKEISVQVDELDLALSLLVRMKDLYPRFEADQKIEFLRILTNKIIVNFKTEIIDLELNAPFKYLTSIKNGISIVEDDNVVCYVSPLSKNYLETVWVQNDLMNDNSTL